MSEQTSPASSKSTELQGKLEDFDAKISIARAFPYGIQHVLAMFVANLAPIAIIAAAAGFDDVTTAMLIQNAMIVAGIGTFIQLFPLWRAGARMPIVMGVSFTFVTVLCGIAVNYGYPAAVGAVIVGGLLEGVLGLFAKYWRKFITPIVSAVVVTSIGFYQALEHEAGDKGDEAQGKVLGRAEVGCAGTAAERLRAYRKQGKSW